jgi:hypothetical protein
VLGFLELPEEDSPPEEYWHSPEHLKDWFEAVKQRREDRYAGIQPMDDEDADMTGNELARQFREGSQ